MKNFKFFISVALAVLVLLAFACKKEQGNELTVNDFKFDGPLGSQGTTIEKIDKNMFRVKLGHAPNHPDWNNKLNFQITGNAKGNNLVLVVEGPPRYAMNEYFYSWSYDMENWNPVQWKLGYRVNPDRDTLAFPVFEQDQVWVGHQVPLSYEQVEEFLTEIEPNDDVDVDTLGKSLEGRNLYRLTITDKTSEVPANKKWVHYITNPHPGEHNAQWRIIGMIEWLLSDQGEDMRQRSICHFVIMISPDGPHNGWYRVNAQGIDMNRSYFPEGSNEAEQAHESFVFQRDLENIMASESPVSTIWGMHTAGGIFDPMLYFSEDGSPGPWTEWRDILEGLDTNNLSKPISLRERPAYGGVSWEYGPHEQFGITAVLGEGGGAIYTKEDNKQTGQILIESLDRFYKGTK